MTHSWITQQTNVDSNNNSPKESSFTYKIHIILCVYLFTLSQFKHTYFYSEKYCGYTFMYITWGLCTFNQKSCHSLTSYILEKRKSQAPQQVAIEKITYKLHSQKKDNSRGFDMCQVKNWHTNYILEKGKSQVF